MSAALLDIPHTPFLPLKFVQLVTGKLCCHPYYRYSFKEDARIFLGFWLTTVSHDELGSCPTSHWFSVPTGRK